MSQGNSWNDQQDLPQQTQNQQNPPRNPPPATESSGLTPKAFTGPRSGPVGAAEGRAYAFGVNLGVNPGAAGANPGAAGETDLMGGGGGASDF